MDDSDKYDPAKYRREGAASDKARLLPGGSTSPYKAASVVDGEVPCLFLVMGKEGFRNGGTAYHTLQYSHIDAGKLGFTDDAQVFSFDFYDLEPKRLIVHGRNLVRVFQQIASKQLSWIRQNDRDFRVVSGDEADEAVITRIELIDWKPKPKAKGQPVQDNALADELA